MENHTSVVTTFLKSKSIKFNQPIKKPNHVTWDTLGCEEELKCFCWKLKTRGKSKFNLSPTVRAGHFGLKSSNLTFASYWKRGIGTLRHWECVIYWHGHLNFLQYVFSTVGVLGTCQYIKTVSACGFSFWHILSDIIFVKKQNLFPPFWCQLSGNGCSRAVTSRKLQAINSTSCSPLLQLCLGNTQPCQALLGTFTLLRARPCGSHTNVLFCSPPVMLERIFLNQNQKPSLSSSGEKQCKWIARPKSPSLMFLGWEHLFIFSWGHSSADQERFWAS